MAKHEFGILKEAPKPNEQFVAFAPEKYGQLLAVPDDLIEPLLDRLSGLECYWHALERPEKNLAYTGITLIPPSSLSRFLAVLNGVTGTEELCELLQQAEEAEKFVIHFGI